MKSVPLTVFAAVGLLLAATPYSHAGSRPASKQYTPVSTKYASSTPAHSGSYERKCMVLSCGSTWCYNVRR